MRLLKKLNDVQPRLFEISYFLSLFLTLKYQKLIKKREKCESNKSFSCLVCYLEFFAKIFISYFFYY